MLLHVQKYLSEHSFTDLAREHGVYARFSTLNPFKFSLNYDQLEASDDDIIASECRGLVLESERIPQENEIVGATRILALPMYRFFNYGTASAAPVNFEDACFYEKLDGTCCILYWDRMLMRWCVATRSVPDADLPIDGFPDKSFTSLFWKAFEASGGSTEALDYARGNMTFVFELCTPENQVIVRYSDYRVYLLAVRDIHTGMEDKPYPWSLQIGVDIAPSYNLGSVNDMVQFVNARSASEHEGIVVCDRNYNRVKVKNSAYMALSRVKDAAVKSPRALLEIILSGQSDDVMPLLPPYLQSVMMQQHEMLRLLMQRMDAEYERLYDSNRKTFAMNVNAANSHMGYMMARWTERCNNFHHWIMSARKNGSWSNSFLDALLNMLNSSITPS
ncbi:MAG: hypothetical protein EB023_12700 [Flavobacteriia bacterium]|nr:hypothetical protein [Flavobacteriia bacterium]